MNDERGNTAITISRLQGGDTDKVRLEIKDRRSGAALELMMTLENFASALTGNGDTPADALRAADLQYWGKQRTLVRVAVSADAAPWNTEALQAWLDKVRSEACPPGFVFSHGHFTNRNQYSMNFAKWE